MKSITINSLTEYITQSLSISEEHENDEIWYRGQSKEKYTLLPSIYRSPYQVENEQTFFQNFKAQSRPYSPMDTKDDWEIYFHMQHFGVPTRLLDWTIDPIIALSFALFSNFDTPKSTDEIIPEDNAVVYLLNNEKLKLKALSEYTVEDLEPSKWSENSLLNKDFHILTPSCRVKETPTKEICIPIEPPLVNDRIIAQKGKFTLFASTKSCKDILNMVGEDEFLLAQLIISKENIPTIKKQLRLMGISKHTVFPSLESLSTVIKESVL